MGTPAVKSERFFPELLSACPNAPPGDKIERPLVTFRHRRSLANPSNPRAVMVGPEGPKPTASRVLKPDCRGGFAQQRATQDPIPFLDRFQSEASSWQSPRPAVVRRVNPVKLK